MEYSGPSPGDDIAPQVITDCVMDVSYGSPYNLKLSRWVSSLTKKISINALVKTDLTKSMSEIALFCIIGQAVYSLPFVIRSCQVYFLRFG